MSKHVTPVLIEDPRNTPVQPSPVGVYSLIISAVEERRRTEIYTEEEDGKPVQKERVLQTVSADAAIAVFRKSGAEQPVKLMLSELSENDQAAVVKACQVLARAVQQ